MKVINVNYNGPSHGRKKCSFKIASLEKKNWNKEYLKNSKIAPNTHFRKKKNTLIFETWVILLLFFAFRKFIKSISRRLYVHS